MTSSKKPPSIAYGDGDGTGDPDRPTVADRLRTGPAYLAQQQADRASRSLFVRALRAAARRALKPRGR